MFLIIASLILFHCINLLRIGGLKNPNYGIVEKNEFDLKLFQINITNVTGSCAEI